MSLAMELEATQMRSPAVDTFFKASIIYRNWKSSKKKKIGKYGAVNVQVFPFPSFLLKKITNVVSCASKTDILKEL